MARVALVGSTVPALQRDVLYLVALPLVEDFLIRAGVPGLSRGLAQGEETHAGVHLIASARPS